MGLFIVKVILKTVNKVLDILIEGVAILACWFGPVERLVFQWLYRSACSHSKPMCEECKAMYEGRRAEARGGDA